MVARTSLWDNFTEQSRCACQPWQWISWVSLRSTQPTVYNNINMLKNKLNATSGFLSGVGIRFFPGRGLGLRPVQREKGW